VLRYLLVVTFMGAIFCQDRPQLNQEKPGISLKHETFLQGDGKKLLPILFDSHVYYELSASEGTRSDLAVVVDVWVNGKKSNSFPSVVYLDKVLQQEGKAGVFVGSTISPFSENKILITILVPSAGNHKIRRMIDLDEYIQKGVIMSNSSFSGSLPDDPSIPLPENELKEVYGVFFAKKLDNANDLSKSAGASDLAIVVSFKPVKPK
jgi:hypothetical protein